MVVLDDEECYKYNVCCCNVCKKTKDGGADGHGTTLFWTKETGSLLFIRNVDITLHNCLYDILIEYV